MKIFGLHLWHSWEEWDESEQSKRRLTVASFLWLPATEDSRQCIDCPAVQYRGRSWSGAPLPKTDKSMHHD